MRRFIIAAAVAGALVGTVPANAEHAGRTVSGSILAPAPNAPTLGIVTRQQRCASVLAQSNGVFGHTVEFDAAEGNGEHTYTLSASGGTPWIVFYETLGTCDNDPAPVTIGTPTTDATGSIPKNAKFAIIVVEGAANTTFNLGIA